MYCRKKLGRRLLFDKNGNDELERSLLAKLKQYFGGQFTSKMEGMLTDIILAKDNQTKYEKYISRNPELHPSVDLSVQVLTTGYWPTYKSSEINLPSEMVRQSVLIISTGRLSLVQLLELICVFRLSVWRCSRGFINQSRNTAR